MSWRVAMRARLGALELDVELEGGSEPVALVGPNGAGKTTLLRWIAGAELAASGVIEIGGETLFDSRRGVDLAPEARRVGYVPQGFGLFPHLSAIDNVAFGLAERGRPAAERRRAATEMLEGLGCAELAERAVSTLSGGEQQKVALARALVVEPRMLLFDEPMAALDAASRRRMRAFLRERLAERGAPAIVVTHDPRDVAALAAEVFVLEGGRIVQRGTPHELASAPGSELVAELFAVLPPAPAELE
ncbi:MAG: ABC transporter ATP-binding protein [Sandaracinaceae bacterium]|nr:ABC transporter ATP-binding protein [Sandaracinaceae bacterium]